MANDRLGFDGHPAHAVPDAPGEHTAGQDGAMDPTNPVSSKAVAASFTAATKNRSFKPIGVASRLIVEDSAKGRLTVLSQYSGGVG
jgi:hypothetical protein